MDGYSVQEAASVLGVAEGRVWELLARGVLFGTPEGDSMRVFLKAQSGPIAAAGTRDEPPRTNGNGEASAFRELLTEFRNLTERYGQALLALGEARGEVAGLRSRVDQLEARLDLRLPPARDEAPVAWGPATPSDVGAEVPLERPGPARAPRPARAPKRATRPRKAASPREAVAGFAEALARAQDPSAAELREPAPVEAAAEEAGAEAEEVLAEVVGPAVQAADASLVPASRAEAEVESGNVEAPGYSAVVVEPDWFADGDFAWLDAAEMEAGARVDEPAAPPPAEALPEVEPGEQPAEPAVAPRQEVELRSAPDAEATIAVEPEPATDFAAWEPPEIPALPEPLVPPDVGLDAMGAPGPEAAAPPEVEAMGEPPAALGAVGVEEAEEEVMWLGAEPEQAPVTGTPEGEHRTERGAWPVADTATPVVDVIRPPLAMTEDELARLALDEGWDESEVAAIRAMITPPPSAQSPLSRELPGSAELDDAMAALEAVPVRESTPDGSQQWAKPAADDSAARRSDAWAFAAEPAAPPPSRDVAATLRKSAAQRGWLGGRQGPAAAAYRRLRRLLPG